MKDILALTSAQDIADWAEFFSVVENLPPDPTTGLNRVAIVRNLHIDPEQETVLINTVIYLLDSNGDPINGRVNEEQRNIVPIEVAVQATNKTYVDLTTQEPIEDLKGKVEGVDYLPEFEARRRVAKAGSIDLFSLMNTGILQSKKV